MNLSQVQEEVPAAEQVDAAGPAKRRRMVPSIGAVLSLLIVVTILPPLAFSVLLLQRTNQAQQEVVTTLAEATAGSIIETVDRQLRGTATTLRVLATSRSLEMGALEDFYNRAKEALGDSGAYLVVADAGMNQVLNTRVPFGTPLGPLSNPGPARLALSSGEMVISDGFYGQTAERWVFNVIVPWGMEERPPLVLIMTLNAETLSGALTRQNLRGGWNAALLDRNKIVLASTFLSSDIGTPFFLGSAAPPQTEGLARQSVTKDGIEYETITVRSEQTGWEAVVWAPAEIVRQPLVGALQMLLIGGTIMMALGAAAAWLLGRQIAKPVRKLAQDAHRLGAGEDVDAEAYPVAEIATVSAALAHAAKERRASESEIRFLMREVAHRSKNQLTVVSSIAKQTARNARGLAAFEESFQRRIQGLARSTDLLIAGGVAGVELKELINAQLEPFRPGDEARVELSGPEYRLSNQAAQTLGLALHELATNASKYGAFSVSAGRLVVSWRRRGDRLEIVWREFVPRLRRRAEGRGFGTEVIERMIGGALGAEIERNLHADGLECRFLLPRDNLEPAGQLAASAVERY